MKISIYTNGGYKGFTQEIDEHCPITVDATHSDSLSRGYHVKVSDLVEMGVYDIDKGQVSHEPNGYGADFNPEKGTLFFMDHEVKEIKPGRVKIILVNDGNYPLRPNNNRTFPVVVNGYWYGNDTVEVDNADSKAIGMYVSDHGVGTFCLQGHPYGVEAHIL